MPKAAVPAEGLDKPSISPVARRLPALRFMGSHGAFRRELLAAIQEEPERARYARAQRKALFLGVMVATSYALLWSGILSGAWLFAVIALSQPLYLITATGIAHDASHGGVFKRRWLNRAGVWVFDLLGINGYVWHFDHVIAHHATPNISRYDANMYGWGPIRLDPHSPLLWHHRFQHLYAPFIYAFGSLFKVSIGDFIALVRTRAEAYLPPKHAPRQYVRLVLLKSWAVSAALVFPLLANAETGWVLGGYLLGHVSAGLLMGSIFQPTHTNDRVLWPLPDGARFSTSFEQHVLETAADFSVANRFVTWIAGGLNIHALHHLFPRIAHLELPRVAAAAQRLAPKHGLEYRVFPTWGAAIRSHFRALYVLGRIPASAVGNDGVVFSASSAEACLGDRTSQLA